MHAGTTQASPMRTKVEQVIEVIRPAIQADQGDIVLHEVDEDRGVVVVELVGACVSCPASTVTLKAGVERILKDRVPGVTAVRDINDDLDITGEPTAAADGPTDEPKTSPFADGGSEPRAIAETPVSL